MATSDELESEVTTALFQFLVIALLLNTEAEQQDPTLLQQSLSGAARHYGMAIRALEATTGERYGLRLRPASEGVEPRDIPALPRPDGESN